MSVEFSAELKRIGQLVTDYILSYPEIAKVKPDYLREGVLFYVQKGGKRLRPGLLWWACAAVGGDSRWVLPAAAAIELSHTWTLVHDDIIDHDDLRRGGPSMHAYFRDNWQRFPVENKEDWGRNLAILVGDLQQALAISMLNALDSLVNQDLKNWLISDLVAWAAEVLHGEMLDMEYALHPLEELSEADILAMLDHKTASTLAWCGRTGALLGLNKLEPGHEFVKLMEEMCRKAGLAFQLQDDILGIVGQAADLGKPVGSDIREGKRTVLVAHAWEQANPAERQLLQSALGNTQATPADIAAVNDLLRSTGSIDYVQKLAEDYTASAREILLRLPASSARDYLQAFIDFITHRHY